MILVDDPFMCVEGSYNPDRTCLLLEFAKKQTQKTNMRFY